MDEPEPLGHSIGPNASRVLAATVGNCLCASLLFCLQRSKIKVENIYANVEGVVARNIKGRWRIQELNVELTTDVSEDDQKNLNRCIGIFKDFCVVSQSVKQGIPINVKVNKLR